MESGSIKNSQLSASASVDPTQDAKYGRLNSLDGGAWCGATYLAQTAFFQIDVINAEEVAAVGRIHCFSFVFIILTRQ